uniref:receptor protein-tyrosine kinase n=2 Tax=Acrobeloides nanus TaxID=290746 RepID=A0A914CIT2_9BILA
MSLEIRRVEVGDKGNWACKVWNNEGSVIRNFTLHIIDFCDYFQHPQFQADRIPKECLCQWAISGGAPLREDSDLPAVAPEDCLKYDKENKEVIKFRRPINETCGGKDCEPIEHTGLRGHMHDESKPKYIVQTAPDTILHPRTINETQDDYTTESPSLEETTLDGDPISSHNLSRNKPDLHAVHESHENITPEAEGHAELRVSDTIIDVEAKLERAKEILDKRPGLEESEDEEDEENRIDIGLASKNSEATTLTTDNIEAITPGNLLEETFTKKIYDIPQALPLINTTTPTTTTSTTNITTTTTGPITAHSTLRQWHSPYKYTRIPTTTTTTAPISTTEVFQTAHSTLRQWHFPSRYTRIAPYFQESDEQRTQTIYSPSGRTLKLSCKAKGQPEPQVIWKRGNVELRRDTERKIGGLYKIGKWTLEMEDVSDSDSGNYECEVWNSAGTIWKQFRVEIRDRLRAKPIIVSNVLFNKTVDVNSTVNFTCEVISDLVPHVTWVKLLLVNGSYIKTPENGKPMFNLLHMHTVKKARTYQDKSINQDKSIKSVLELTNVTLEDQGIYSCIAGNSLGYSMGNATLTVNEFKTTFLPTEHVHPPWPITYWILLVISILLIIAFFVLAALYLLFSKKFAKNRIQTFEKMAVRKKVVITKKPNKDGELWSDPASSYAITIEPVIGEALPRDLERDRLSSEMTMLTDYEVPTDLAWEIDRSRLKLCDVLGEGAFGEVWRGILRPKYAKENDKSAKEIPVAVKKLKPSAQEKELIILVGEMQIFKSIGEHKNVLKLIGCCTGLGPLFVILELCPYGNLRDFLRKHRPRDDGATYPTEENSKNYLQPKTCVIYQNLEFPGEVIIKNLTLRDLVRFSTEIARGMEFLATKKIIHRDLAARNILVAADFSMKISDFGLSRNVVYNDYYRKKGPGRIPIKWMAPEALDKNMYTVYSDVWSYGIVLWEVMTLGGTPYPSIAMPQLYNILKQGYRMESPHNCPEEIYGVMVMCWQEKPETRPNFTLIADYFDWMLAEAANYNANIEIDGKATPDDDTRDKMIYNTPKSARKRKDRPLSAPGMMSFEVFASNIATTSISESTTQTTIQEQETNLDDLPSPQPLTESSPLLHQIPDEPAPELPQKPLRRNQSTDVSSLKSKRQIAEHFYINCNGHSSSNGSPLWSSNVEDEQDVEVYELKEKDSGQATRTNSNGSEKQDERKAHTSAQKLLWPDSNYMNTLGEPGPSTSTSNTLPHQSSSTKPKYALSRQDRFSDSSAYEAEFNMAYPRSSEHNVQSSKDPKNTTTELMQRSQSVESQGSSGRGGSSAMSSAEGLGGIGDFCKIEYAEIMPMLKKPSPPTVHKTSRSKNNKFSK